MNNTTRYRPDDTAEIPVTQAAPADEKKKPLLELSLTQIIGGALAAMTAAGLGSTLGVAGTIVGAAFASMVAGVAGALYTTSLRRTRDRVKTVFVGRGAATTPVMVQEAESAVPVKPLRRFPWKAALIATFSMFVLAAVAITGVEAVTGRALSGGAGTTVQKVGGASHVSASPSATSPASTETSATPEPSETPSAAVPAEPSGTPSSSADPTAPTESTTPAPSSEPTPSGPEEAPSAAAS